MPPAVAQPQGHAELVALLERVLGASARAGGMRFSARTAYAVEREIFLRRYRPLTVQAVYLARIADLCRPGGYAELLMASVDRAQPGAFRRAIEEAVSRPGPASSRLTVVDGAVTVQRGGRPALRLWRGDGTDAPVPLRAFTLTYAQMPRALAMLEILQDALDFPTVDGLIAPALGDRPAVEAEAAARDISDRFTAWLDPRLASEHHLRKARRIRAYLDRCGRTALGTPDDDLILAFWQAVSVDDADLGFRLYRSSVQGVLRYALAETLCDSETRVWDESVVPAAETPDGDVWVSPVEALVRPPANRVKWLNKTEQARLRNFLGGERGAQEGPLAPGRPFPANLYRTLLRADRFGPIQDQLVRAGADGERRRQAFGALASEQADYAGLRQAYVEIADQAETMARAALEALVRSGAPEAVRLVRVLLPDQGLAAYLPKSVDGPGSAHETAAAITLELRRLRAIPEALDPPLADLLSSAREAARKVRREGLRPGDETADRDEALASAIDALAALIVALAGLAAALERAPLESWGRQDAESFAVQLAGLYAARTRGDRDES